MNKRALLRILSLMMVVSFLVSACGTTPSPVEAPTTAPQAQPTAPAQAQPTEAPEAETPAKAELVRPLVLAWYGTPPSIDGDVAGGGAQAAAVNTCEPLVEYKPILNSAGYYEMFVAASEPDEFEPRLAESWEVSEDGLTWTFHLRQGVKSNFGNELTAEDVKWSYERAFGAKGVGGWVVANALRLAGPEAVTAVDKYTVQITTKAFDPIFLNVLRIYTPCIHDTTELKKHLTTEDPWGLQWTATHNATFGPWQLSELTPGVQAVFTPNPNYYRGQPYFSKVIWREIPVSANRMAVAQAGDVDIAFRLTKRELSEFAGNPDVKIPVAQTNLTHQWRLNFNVPPFDNVKVRQAMAYAVPYDEILEKVYYGLAQPMKSFLMPWADGYDPSLWVYEEDLDKAKSLLAEAGYPDGFEASVMLSGDWPEYEELAVLIKSNLAKIGVTLNIDKFPEAKFNENRYARTFPATIDYDQAQVPVGIYAASLLFSTGSLGISNFNNYSSPEMDALIEQAWNEPDAGKRAEMYGEMQRILAEDVGWVYLALPDVPDALKSSIEGWTWYPDNQIRWYDLYEKTE